MMAYFERWRIPPDFQSPDSDERVGGVVRRYVPDLLMEVDNSVSAEVAEYVGDVTAQAAAFGAVTRARPLSTLYATLLKSESISSSLIEGYRTPPGEVLMAEFDPGSTSAVAMTVWRNVQALNESLSTLDGEWTADAVHGVHHKLLPHQPYGCREQQVRIGGRSLFRAAFVPPSADVVPAYLDDLVRYANGGGETTLTKAAVLHAQFETIHPYGDGNGRTGRALVHALFKRAGLVEGAVLPVSTVLKARQDEYVEALGKYRYDGVAGVGGAVRASRREAVDWFVRSFTDAVNDSVTLAGRVRDDVDAVEASWAEKTRHIRSDSVAHAILAALPDAPIVTAESVSRRFGVTAAAAARAIGRLADAGVLAKAAGKHKKSSAYLAPDILALMVDAERRAASPQFDTVLAAPVLHTPPPSGPLDLGCGAWMPKSETPCVLSRGHAGRHKGRRVVGESVGADEGRRDADVG